MPETEDIQLEIKKRARRRLVGAVALSLFAAILFPLVMDRDPSPLIQDIEVRIPGQDDRNHSQRLALAHPETSSPDVQNQVSQPANTPPSVTVIQQPNTSQTPSSTRSDKTPESERVKPGAKQGNPVTENVSTERKTEKTVETPIAKVSDKITEKASDKGQFIIQIGAFGNEGNVKNLRNKLADLGVRSYTEPLGDKTRVRAGPFPSRDAAEKALTKMKGIGVNGLIAAR